MQALRLTDCEASEARRHLYTASLLGEIRQRGTRLAPLRSVALAELRWSRSLGQRRGVPARFVVAYTWDAHVPT
ncbi:hypothetical protein C8034_v002898 [Colletotrichum sidae]|uniref:Uncharacterized protein n=1 Tax=Colletotrichum sidae TaxID=1347389 RepID=A0A4R8TVI2_9PEZI|nr:hypothetical protein C8034_v002898 [Colletotrichum sidae]